MTSKLATNIRIDIDSMTVRAMLELLRDLQVNGIDWGSLGKFTTVEVTTSTSSSPVANTLYAGSGRWVKFDEKTASSSATLDFTSNIDSRFRALHFTLEGILPATDAQDLWVRVSEDGGSTFKAGGADYAYSMALASQASLGNSPSGGAAQIKIGHSLSNGAGKGGEGHWELGQPGGTTLHKRISGWFSGEDSGPGFSYWFGVGTYKGTVNAINGIRFMFASGNIASGTIVAEGLLSN